MNFYIKYEFYEKFNDIFNIPEKNNCDNIVWDK